MFKGWRGSLKVKHHCERHFNFASEMSGRRREKQTFIASAHLFYCPGSSRTFPSTAMPATLLPSLLLLFREIMTYSELMYCVNCSSSTVFALGLSFIYSSIPRTLCRRLEPSRSPFPCSRLCKFERGKRSPAYESEKGKHLPLCSAIRPRRERQ